MSAYLHDNIINLICDADLNGDLREDYTLDKAEALYTKFGESLWA